jgi:hypothetical protein
MIRRSLCSQRWAIPTAWMPALAGPTPVDKTLGQQPCRRPVSPARLNQQASSVTKLFVPSIATANLRSLDNKEELVNHLITDANIDIFCLTETWLNEDKKAASIGLLSKNVQVFSTERNRADKVRGGGTMILVNKGFCENITPLTIDPPPPPPWPPPSSQSQSSLEFTAIKIKPRRLPRGYSCCLVICVYLPAWIESERDLASYHLQHVINEATSKCTSGSKPLIIVAGDLNGLNTEVHRRMHTLRQLNSQPTRGDNTLDVILTNTDDIYNCINMPEIGGSDHLMVLARPSITKKQVNKIPIKKGLCRSGKIIHTVACIRQIDWDQVIPFHVRNFAFGNGQQAFDAFYDSVRNAEDINQPTRMVRFKNDQPWMTGEIKHLIAVRQKLFHSNKFAEWKLMCSTVRSLIYKRKKAYHKELSLGDKKLWNEVNILRKLPSSIESAGIDLANSLNNGFYAVWNNNTQPNIERFINLEAAKDSPCLFNTGMVVNLLKNLGPSASGPDKLSSRLLKSARLEIAEILASLFNQCLQHSFVPEQFKRSNIVPIPKTPFPIDPSHFRPIALCSEVAKVVERGISQFIHSITWKLWRLNKQYGFIPGKSTMDAIVQVIEDWNLALDEKLIIIAIFFDFAKAFDLVDHEILLTKLQRYLPAWLISWIAAYLSDRKQRVTINGHETEWKKVEAGVIQGSVLGPVLFLLFIADINDVLPANVELLKYADDILTYIMGKNPTSDLPQAIVDAVSAWCVVNKMRLNTDKCKIMVTKSRHQAITTDYSNITLNNVALEVVPTYKYLGVEINNSLNWDNQLARVQKQTRSVPYLLKALKRLGHSQKTLIGVYRSLVHSHYAYSAPLLTSANAKSKAEMASFQNRNFRIINISPSVALSKYNVDSIEHLIENTCTKLLKRILADENHPLTQKIPRVGRSKSSFVFKNNRARTTAYANSFVQKFIRFIRDGNDKLYTNRSMKSYNIIKIVQRRPPPPSTSTSPVLGKKHKIPCTLCGKMYAGAGMASHIRYHERNANQPSSTENCPPDPTLAEMHLIE